MTTTEEHSRGKWEAAAWRGGSASVLRGGASQEGGVLGVFWLYFVACERAAAAGSTHGRSADDKHAHQQWSQAGGSSSSAAAAAPPSLLAPPPTPRSKTSKNSQ